jgi:hypothetical protein
VLPVLLLLLLRLLLLASGRRRLLLLAVRLLRGALQRCLRRVLRACIRRGVLIQRLLLLLLLRVWALHLAHISSPGIQLLRLQTHDGRGGHKQTDTRRGGQGTQAAFCQPAAAPRRSSRPVWCLMAVLARVAGPGQRPGDGCWRQGPGLEPADRHRGLAR